MSLKDPQETIDCLEKQLAKITAELVETKEEMEKKTKGKLGLSVTRKTKKKEMTEYCKIRIISISITV